MYNESMLYREPTNWPPHKDEQTYDVLIQWFMRSPLHAEKSTFTTEILVSLHTECVGVLL